MYNLLVDLKPQDIVVIIKLLEYEDRRPPYAEVVRELYLSASEVHAAVQRAKHACLLAGPDKKEITNKAVLEEFLVDGVKYAFPPDRGELIRGMPTAYAAEPLKSRISAGNEPSPVWPYPRGKAR